MVSISARPAAFLFLAAPLLLLGCAAGPAISPENRPVVASLSRIKVVCSNPWLREQAEERIRREVGLAVAASSETGVPELRLDVACESTFDLWQPPLPINSPSSNLDEETAQEMRSHSSGVQPSCSAQAALYAGTRVLWRDAASTTVIDARSAPNLVAILCDHFLRDWREAKGAGEKNGERH
jgi:hypothetical protein